MRTVALERSLAAEDERLDRIERASTWEELEAALTTEVAVPDKVDGPSRAWRVLAVAAVAVPIVALAAVATVAARSSARIDWSEVRVGTADPFVGAPAASVYLVPLDRDAWNADGGLSLLSLRETLARRQLEPVLTRPLALEPEVFDEERMQLNGEAVVARLADAFERHARPGEAVVVIGVTSLDQYSPTFSSDRFAFMAHTATDAGGVAVISTARLKRGEARLQSERLLKLALRAAGFYVLHVSRTTDWSVMHDPIRSLDDLDRMRPTLGRSKQLLHEAPAR